MDMMTTQTSETQHRIGFVLISGFALMSCASAIEPLRAANLFSGRKLYTVDYLALDNECATSSSGAKMRATASLDEDLDFDYVFIVAGGDPTTFNDDTLFRWLRRQVRKGTSLGGISGGPVILALANVMDGRRMTVHWEHAPVLKELSPRLHLERDIYVIDRDRLTCAGGIAPLDMMHSLIAEHHGAHLARKVSDWFLHTDIRPSSDPQRAGLAERYGLTNRSLLAAIEAMDNHIADPLDLKQIAKISGLGTRQLTRLFSEHLGKSAMAFYRELRLEKAGSLLAQSTMSITEIALASGFSDSAHFSRSYREHYGTAPSLIRKGNR